MASQDDWLKEWNDWDPISSGENDLPSLDDMTKLFSAASKHSKSQNAIDFTSSINGMAPNASIFSCTDSANGNHTSNEVKQINNVDHVSVENVAAMVAKSVPYNTNGETEPCEDPYLTAISISDGLSLKGSVRTDNYGAAMINVSSMCNEDVEITDQVDDVSVFTKIALNFNYSLDSSLVGSRDQISMVDNDTIVTVEEHYLKKIKLEEKISSSANVELDGYPDKMEVLEQLLVPIEASPSSYPNQMGGQDQLTLPLETIISGNAQVKQDSGSVAASTSVILSDGSAKLKMQTHEDTFSKRNNSKGFLTKIKNKRKRVSTVEIAEVDVFLEDLSTSTKEDQFFSPENDCPLKKAQCLAMAGGVSNRLLHKSGKQRLRRSHHRGYLLTSRNLLKPMLFKKTVGRLRRMR